MKRALPLFLLLLPGCTASLSVPTSSDAIRVSLTRAAQGQPILRVIQAPPGEADRALMQAQGYVEAQDRFVQMDFLRRAALGTLAEVAGPAAEKKDVLVHAVGLPQAIARSAERLPREAPEAQELAEAFAEGVNRFLHTIDWSQPETLRYYRELTGDREYRPAPWTARDSIAIADALAFSQSSAMETKLLYGAIFAATGRQPHLIPKLFDLRAIEPEFILGPAARRRVGAERPVARGPIAVASPALTFTCPRQGFPFPGCDRPGGSNSWVARAGDGAVYLANDPHLPLTYPTTFYELSLDSQSAGGTLHVRGLNIPGLPGILAGHNEEVAWGLTNSMADVDEVFVEETDRTGGKVLHDGKLVAIERTFFTLRVADGKGAVAEKRYPLRRVPHHGPIVSDFVEGAGQSVLSYQWTGHEGSLGLAAILGFDRARDFTTFKAALSRIDAGAENFVYADRAGNIGYYTHGKFPNRPNLSVFSPPYFPRLGIGPYDWSGYRSRYPELFNPASGRIVTANNDPFGTSAEELFDGFEDYFSFRFEPGIRAARIREALDGLGGALSVAKMMAIQSDHEDKLALRFLALLRKTPGPSPALAGWSADVSRDSREAELYHAWLYVLLEEQFGKLVPRAYLPAYLATPAGVQSLYWDLEDSAARDPKGVGDRLRLALARAERELAAKGRTARPWGTAHPLALVADSALLFPPPPPQAGPTPRDGSWFTIDVGGYEPHPESEASFPSSYGPNFRLVLELRPGHPIEGRNALPGGPDLADWLGGRARPLVPFSP